MSQRVITQLVSDLTGEEIEDGEGRTVTFGLEGAEYSIDLTDDEAAGARAGTCAIHRGRHANEQAEPHGGQFQAGYAHYR